MGPRRDPDRWQLPPALLGECRECLIPLGVSCPKCGRTWPLPLEALVGDDSMPVQALGRMLKCECGRRGGLDVTPERRAWVKWLRATGQHRRLPYTAGFVREDEDEAEPAPGVKSYRCALLVDRNASNALF